MKKIMNCLLLFMIISQAQTITGQTNDNAIVLPNSSWSILLYGLGSELKPCCVATQYVYFEEDSTVADGRTYKKVFSCNDELRENIKYEGLMREQDKKTYFIPENSEAEHLLYDFSLEEGTTFEYVDYTHPELTEPLYVRNSDIVEINGYPRKRLQISQCPPYENTWTVDTWIEGIGSLSGILYPCYRLFRVGGVKKLLCQYRNDELIYKNSDYSECYYDKVEDITSVKSTAVSDLAVYPNPVDHVLVISSPNETDLFVELTGISGKTVYAKRLDADKEHQIDVSRFASGLYFLRIYDANGRTSAFKIIKR